MVGLFSLREKAPIKKGCAAGRVENYWRKTTTNDNFRFSNTFAQKWNRLENPVNGFENEFNWDSF